jgi:adenylate kinase family enzyme
MKRVAIFGNASGGKSTLARHLAGRTRLPLYCVDVMQFWSGGEAVPHQEYLKMPAEDEWIIDGYGGIGPAWERFSRADTLVYIDLPLVTHGWRVTKRLIRGLLVAPEGWPENSPLWSRYRVLWPCHRQLTPKYTRLVAEEAANKQVHHLKSPAEVAAFLDAVGREYASGSRFAGISRAKPLASWSAHCECTAGEHLSAAGALKLSLSSWPGIPGLVPGTSVARSRRRHSAGPLADDIANSFGP